MAQHPEEVKGFISESTNYKRGTHISSNSLPMNEMDPTLLDFIKIKVDSFIKWDLARLFHDNPNTTDTAESIAKYAGRNVSKVKPELEDLVESGVLEKRALNGMFIYSLTSDEEMRALVDRFAFACEDRLFRVKAVYHIIRGTR